MFRFSTTWVVFGLVLIGWPLGDDAFPVNDQVRKVQPMMFGSSDPECQMSPEEIIRHWGYPVESYKVTTEDGYILSVLRIPHGRDNSTIRENRPVVYLQHGLECSCMDWISNLPGQSAGFLFADAGFDVWMGNFRGNTYSKLHVAMSSDQHEYWKFSWDEMARYDLPAMINLVLNTTKVDQIYYVGHSMGTMTAFALFSQNPEIASKIKRFYAMGPVTTVKHISGIFRWMAPFIKSYNVFAYLFGIDQFLPNNWVMDKLATLFCGTPVIQAVCGNIIFLFSGPNSKQLNETRLPVYLTHTPAGTSTQNIIHFGQMVYSGQFQMYDYGNKKTNMAKYNSEIPPSYDLGKMKVPVALYWGGLDWLADPLDVETLIPQLLNVIDNVYLSEFNHLDFIWGLRAAPQVYWPILRNIRDDFAYQQTANGLNDFTPEIAN